MILEWFHLHWFIWSRLDSTAIFWLSSSLDIFIEIAADWLKPLLTFYKDNSHKLYGCCMGTVIFPWSFSVSINIAQHNKSAHQTIISRSNVLPRARFECVWDARMKMAESFNPLICHRHANPRARRLAMWKNVNGLAFATQIHFDGASHNWSDSTAIRIASTC
jgi:hypothetical protein